MESSIGEAQAAVVAEQDIGIVLEIGDEK